MLSKEAKREYQKEYMKRKRSNKQPVRPAEEALDPVRPSVTPVRPVKSPDVPEVPMTSPGEAPCSLCNGTGVMPKGLRKAAALVVDSHPLRTELPLSKARQASGKLASYV